MVNAKRFPSDVVKSKTFQSHVISIAFLWGVVVCDDTVMIVCVMAGFLLFERYMGASLGDFAGLAGLDCSNTRTSERTPYKINMRNY